VLTSRDGSSLVIDKLVELVKGKNTVVLGFYFDFAAREEQSARWMLGSLLRQMLSGIERIPGEISRTFQEHKKVMGGRRPQLATIVMMLQVITSLRPTFICIDALDECAGEQRVRLLNSLKQILNKSPNTRIFVTGRPHIGTEIEERLTVRVIRVSIGPRKDDIITYLRAKLSDDETPDIMDESLKADILQRIPEAISEMCVRAMTSLIPPNYPLIGVFRFLLVSLNIDAILQESTKYGRRKRLSKMIGGLDLLDAYGATLERIKAQGGEKSRLGMAALMWVSHAERPLKADELRHALAVVPDSTDFNADNVPLMSTLVGCCQGLITVDKKASTVRLIHITLKEYLSTNPDIFNRSHSGMAETCLTYLNSGQIKAISADPSPDILSAPFLEYCSVYWGVHAREDLSARAMVLALDLLQHYDGHISGKLLLGQARHLYVKDFGITFPFNGLHCASFFGIVEVADALIAGGTSDINGRDFSGLTPLAWAARNGHDGMVKMLLEREAVDPDKPDNSGQTPLSRAAGKGNEGVVQILLSQARVSPDKPNNYGLTPLSCAARNGHEGVVKILLGRKEVNPGEPNCVGVTPLMFATRHGHKRVTELLQAHKAAVHSTAPFDT